MLTVFLNQDERLNNIIIRKYFPELFAASMCQTPFWRHFVLHQQHKKLVSFKVEVDNS